MNPEDMKPNNLPPELFYVALATIGGMARYLTAYKARNGRFAWGAFLVASFVSGFSGYMFAVFGISMGLPEPMLFMMAGIGGFMGEHALRLLGEHLVDRYLRK